MNSLISIEVKIKATLIIMMNEESAHEGGEGTQKELQGEKEQGK